MAPRGLLLQVLERFTGQANLAFQIGLLGVTLEFLALEDDLAQLVLKLESVLHSLGHRIKTVAQDRLFIGRQGPQLVGKVLLGSQPCVARLLEAQVPLAFVEVNDALAVFEDATFDIDQALQPLDVTVDAGHGIGRQLVRGRVVVQAFTRRRGFCGGVGSVGAFSDVLKSLGDRVSQQGHVPQINIVLVGLCDNGVSLIESCLEPRPVLLRERIHALTACQEGPCQLDIGPDRLETADHRPYRAADTAQGIDDHGDGVGRLFCPVGERAIRAQALDTIHRVVGT